MLDALNAIVDFLNTIVNTVVSFVTYINVFTSFLTHGVQFLYSCMGFIPAALQPFAMITIVLMVIMLFLGRSNNSG